LKPVSIKAAYATSDHGKGARVITKYNTDLGQAMIEVVLSEAAQFMDPKASSMNAGAAENRQHDMLSAIQNCDPPLCLPIVWIFNSAVLADIVHSYFFE
jgi:hypothetical protein